MIEVFRYQAADGNEPLTEWLKSLRDKQAQAKVRTGSSDWKQETLGIANRSAMGCLSYANTLALVIVRTTAGAAKQS